LLADDALVLHALVLAAQALVILDRPEDARAEQAVALGLEGAVIDGFRLFDLAVGPRQNLLRARDRNADLVEDLSRRLRAEEIHNFLVHRILRLPTSPAAIVPFASRDRLKRGPASPARGRLNSLFSRFLRFAAGALPLLLGIVQIDIEAERTHFLDQHVEAFRNARFEGVVA